MITTAVIMAAGMGTRFGRYTESVPKGFVEFGGMPMIERSIRTLVDSGLVVSVLYPEDPNWNFEKVHDYCYERGFTIYPGKISTSNTFRLCALGTIDEQDIKDFFVVMKGALDEYNIKLK